MLASNLSLVLGLILIISLLSGCNSLAETPIPTPFPTEHLPTVIAMTLEAQGIELPSNDQPTVDPETPALPTPTLEPSATQSPSPEPIPFTATPSSTPQPTQSVENLPSPANIPQSINQIITPGSGSKVTSPFILRATVKLNPDSVVRIELLGEDGSLLMRDVRGYQNLDNEWISLGSEIAFGINGVAEAGRLQISIEDEQGRLQSVSSVDLILQSVGNQDLYLPQDQLEDIYLESPKSNRLIQDGTMRVSGMARTRSAQPLRIEILTSDGRIVGTRQVTVIPSTDYSYGTYVIDVPFTVDKTNRALVQVWEPGDRIPGIVNLSSVEVLLSP
jgi:hypothetical protein